MMFLLLSPDRHEVHAGGGGEDISTMPFAYVQLAILVVALVFEVVVFVRNTQLRINVFAFASQIRKLLDAGNAERARKLCGAAPDAWASRLVRVGIEAHERNASVRDAMRAELPSLLAGARSLLLPAVVIGVIADMEGLFLLVRGFEGHANGEFDAEVLSPFLLLSIFTALNATRWGAWQRDLDEVVETLTR